MAVGSALHPLFIDQDIIDLSSCLVWIRKSPQFTVFLPEMWVKRDHLVFNDQIQQQVAVFVGLFIE